MRYIDLLLLPMLIIDAAAAADASVGLTTVVMENRTRPTLTFAENIYVKLSGASATPLHLINVVTGRAMIDLQHTNFGPVKEINTMKIIQLNGNTMRTFQIDDAFVSLMRPSVFDITKQTKVIIHGFKDSSQSPVPMDLAKAYNEKGMFNVLMVDAENVVNKWYLRSVYNARLVGKRLANLLANIENHGANSEDIHLLGISLGAHIAGWAGKYFKKYKGKSIGRITGLDPAGPCFSFAHSDHRLDIGDAKYVDVVHSNRLVQGTIEPLGHADFYVNGGGPNQPGCFTSNCSHLRAAIVYTESVRLPKSFIGVKCNSWEEFIDGKCSASVYAVLGYGSSVSSRGVFYLSTESTSPYGLGVMGTKTIPLLDNFIRTLKFPKL